MTIHDEQFEAMQTISILFSSSYWLLEMAAGQQIRCHPHLLHMMVIQKESKKVDLAFLTMISLQKNDGSGLIQSFICCSVIITRQRNGFPDLETSEVA